MSPRARSILIGIAALVAAALLYLWWTSTHKRVWVDRPVPVEGEASYNAYFVIQQALRAQGVTVQSLPHLPEAFVRWNANDSLLLGSDPKTLSPDQQHALLDWVGRGGHLLVAAGSDHEAGGGGLLGTIGIGYGGRMRCVHWSDATKADDPMDCFDTFQILPAERDNYHDLAGDPGDGWIAASRGWGLGAIEVVGDLQILHNRRLGSTRDAQIAWQVVAPLVQGGTLHIVYQSELPPLYVYLVRYGWFALLPLLIALLGWLWARSQRFGPARAKDETERRALGEHIMASGEYLYRRGLVPALYAPLRRRFDDQLRRRDPELAALPVDAIARELARRRKLPLETVRQALTTPPPKKRKAFESTVKTLLHLLRHP